MRAWATAPGKAILSGEYAVLFGAPAVCAAVERGGGRARAWVRRSAIPPSALSLAVARHALERIGAAPDAAMGHALAARLVADTTALRLEAGGPKLGLGSSAAAAAALSAAALQALGAEAPPSECLAVALRAHRHACAPDGSGADVAAAVLGGIVRVERDGTHVRTAPTALPPGVDVRVFFTGAPAATAPRVAAVLRRAEDPAVAEVLRQLGAAARRFAAACVAGDAAALLGAVRDQAEGLDALGRSVGEGIVTAPHRRAIELARAEGGAGKPSGAGGGDVVVCFAPEVRAGERIAAGAARAGLLQLPLRIGAPGVAMRTSFALDTPGALAYDGRGP